MNPREIFKTVAMYAHSHGATLKIVGEYGYRSPRYNQKTNKGRFVKFKGYNVQTNEVLIFDNKRGTITIHLS